MTEWDDRLQAAVDRQVADLWRGVAPGLDAAALQGALVDAVSGGKRLRPRLVAEVHDGLGGRRPEAVVDAAAAVELLHTAFVVQDDLIDADDVRRGRPSVPGRFRAAATATGASQRGATAYAVAGAVLTGDLALCAALRAVATLPAPPDVTVRVLERVTRSMATSAAGELADVRFSLGAARPDLGEVLELAYRKTADYSFVLPMQVGALLAGAADEAVDLLGRAGRCLGIAFQLRDDLAGVFGDPEHTGKDLTADLREGKLTLLICHARSTPAWERVARHWGDPDVTTSDLRGVRRELEECGSRAHVETVAQEQLRAGLAAADAAGIGVPAATWLAALLDPDPGVAA